MKKVFVICGHGMYASGMISFVETVCGVQEDLFAVDFLGDDCEESIKTKMLEIIDTYAKDSKFIFVCDIIGGTPFKIAATISNYNKNCELVVGISPGALVEGLFQRSSTDICELADEMVTSSIKFTLKFKKI